MKRTVYEGKWQSAGITLGVVAGRFNDLVVERLVAGADDALRRTGGASDALRVYWAPGAFEIPQVTSWVLESAEVDAIVCLGAVIRGATPHFDQVAGAVTRGVAALAERSAIPITFGVLTTDNIDQALERAGSKAGNKGFEATLAALEMLHLRRSMSL